MKKYIFSVFALVLILSSCTDLSETLFDGIPESKFPENNNQTANIGVGAYDPLKELMDNGGWWFCQEITTDEMVGPTRNTDWDDNGKWRLLQLHTWTNETEAIVGMWERYYRGIAECNKTIEVQFNNDTTATASAASKDAIAKFLTLRSFYYWLLIDNYGDVPYETSFANAVAKPFKTHRAIVYQRIVKDLVWSIPRLKKTSVHYSVSKGMAQMTLARLYLNSKVYTGIDESAKAIPVLEDLIATGGYSLAVNVKDPFLEKNDACPENIFTAYYDGTENANKKPEFNLHMRTLGYQSNQTFKMTVGPWNGFATLEKHFLNYTSIDKRKDAYFLYGPQKTFEGAPLLDAETNNLWDFSPTIPALSISESGGFTKSQVRHSGVRIQKYEVAVSCGQSMANDYVFFRLTDAYLMLAELYANQNNAAKVQQYLDPIRTRAGLGSPAAYNLDAVKTERKMEMFYEGTRRQDMIRWGIFNNPWDCAWKLQINSSDNSLFPIPKKQIDANSNLSLAPIN
ncbi:MAG TPA: RagB/SusD family nutrient uptake outer membrane protein [Paludibacter sp.]